MVRQTKDEKIAELEAKLVAASTVIDSNFAVPVPMTLGSKPYINGWAALKDRSEAWAVKAWQRGHLYGYYDHIDEGDTQPLSGTKLGFPIYATEVDAWIAARIYVETAAKKELQKLDEQIVKLLTEFVG